MIDVKNEYLHTAVIEDNKFTHFGIHPISASLYGHEESEIVSVVLEVHEDQTPVTIKAQELKAVDYWGWFDKERKAFTMIYQQYFLLDMCFPYGIKAEEDRDFGKAYRLRVSLKQ
jgi:hypothetical protein